MDIISNYDISKIALGSTGDSVKIIYYTCILV